MSEIRSIPRPLVRANQWTIFLSVILTWITGQDVDTSYSVGRLPSWSLL